VVASLLGWHEHHRLALAALEDVESRGDVLLLPGHVLVESYAVLTRLPARHRVAPAVALELLRTSFERRVRVVTLSAEEIWALLDGAGRLQIAGGAVYDARILAAARKAGADALLTFDVRDYERLDPGEVRIVAP